MNIAHVDLKLEGCSAEVWLNDVPILRASAPDGPRFTSRPVNEFVHEGENVLSVVPFPGPTPETSRKSYPVGSDSTARISAALSFYAEGEFPGDGEGRQAVKVVMSGGPASGPLAPVVQSCQLGSGQGLGTWAWQRAQPISGAASAAIESLVRAAHEAFERLDARFFLELGSIHFDEYARAYPAFDGTQLRERFRDGFKPRPDDPPWRIAALDPAGFDFRPCADGRMLEILDKEYRPILRSTSIFYPLRMFVGQFGGRLCLLRLQ